MLQWATALLPVRATSTGVFQKHPAGRQFYDFFGENVFRADMCNADVKLRRSARIHEGSAKHAQKFATKVFNADKTYFVR